MILDNHNLEYDAFKKMCAGINERIKKKMKEKSSNSNLFYGEFYRRFNSNFLFEIEYRTTVLSRETHLIDLGCQSASYEITFTLERHFFTHKTLVHKTLFTGSDDPAPGRMIWLAQPVRLWTRPDDPAVVVGVRLNLSVQVRMIRT